MLQRDESGSGGWGPNLLTRSDPDTFAYVDQVGAARLDEIFRVSEQYGVYHKLTLFHKNDDILNRFLPDGTVTANWDDLNRPFYSAAGTGGALVRKRLCALFRGSLVILPCSAFPGAGQRESPDARELRRRVCPDEPRPRPVAQAHSDVQFVLGMVRGPVFQRSQPTRMPSITRTSTGTPTRPDRERPSIREKSSVRNTQILRPMCGSAGTGSRNTKAGSDSTSRSCGEKVAWHATARNPNIPTFQETRKAPTTTRNSGPMWAPWDTRVTGSGIPGCLSHTAILSFRTSHTTSKRCSAAYERFMQGEPLSNGRYTEIGTDLTGTGQVILANTTGSLRAWGRLDPVAGKGMLWIDNANHTWWNVVQGNAIPAAGARLTIQGLPAGTYAAEWWDTTSGTVTRSETYTVGADGRLSFSVSNLASDVAVKFTNTRLAQVSIPLIRAGTSWPCPWSRPIHRRARSSLPSRANTVRSSHTTLPMLWITDLGCGDASES